MLVYKSYPTVEKPDSQTDYFDAVKFRRKCFMGKKCFNLNLFVFLGGDDDEGPDAKRAKSDSPATPTPPPGVMAGPPGMGMAPGYGVHGG